MAERIDSANYTTGVPIRTANIFKLTDDLRRYLFTVPVAVPVDPPQQNVPPQALASKPTNDPNTPAGYDPFNPTRSAVDPGLNYGGPNFMSRLNGGGNNPGISLSQAQSEWDTPITMNSNGTHYDEDITMDDSHTLPNESEAPHAPLRKKNGLQTLMGDMIDAPKIRSMTTRGRIKHDPPSELDGRPTTSGIPVSHKRTISGLPPPSSAASSDAGVRRSTRIQNHVTAGTAPTAKSNASSRLAGVFKSDPKDKKELPKAKATGTRGRAGISTVGRVVSGNRKAPGPGERDIDSKELSRPASVASTIRSEATIRETTSKRGGASIHPNIIIEQQQSSHEEEGEALRWLLDLFAKLAEGYYNLTRYNAPKALEIFRALPPSQRETPWVLTKIGRALYERSQYKEAADVFAKVRKLHPSGNGRDSSAGESAYMEDMHIYSTTLWHLKRDIDLAYLSHSLISDDRLRPEPWVALGNCYSLQHEPDKAIRCFRRATQLCGERGVGAYAWTLMGHEHVAQEEFDRAQLCYREAISSNPRHYAGWYGLGSVYEKLGKYDIAERHYRIAWGVNPRNGVLAVCLGLVCEKLRKEGNTGSGAAWVLDPRGEGRVKEALAWYERAVRMDPKSAKARFMKARTLMRLAQMPASAASHGGRGGAGDNRHARLLQAKEELETLREMAPDESMVHFLLGRCFKLLGDRAGAIREMTIALELDPKVRLAFSTLLLVDDIDCVVRREREMLRGRSGAFADVRMRANVCV
jgi:anaphase-promoting complex subunit 3